MGTSSANSGEHDATKRAVTNFLENLEAIFESQRVVGLATVSEVASNGHFEEAVTGVGGLQRMSAGRIGRDRDPIRSDQFELNERESLRKDREWAQRESLRSIVVACKERSGEGVGENGLSRVESN